MGGGATLLSGGAVRSFIEKKKEMEKKLEPSLGSYRGLDNLSCQKKRYRGDERSSIGDKEGGDEHLAQARVNAAAQIVSRRGGKGGENLQSGRRQMQYSKL